MNHEIEVSANGNTVWVNSGEDGSCIGRFDKRFGMDVHRSGSEQMAGKSECLHCTHGRAGREDWELFIREMDRYYGVRIDPALLSFS